MRLGAEVLPGHLQDVPGSELSRSRLQGKGEHPCLPPASQISSTETGGEKEMHKNNLEVPPHPQTHTHTLGHAIRVAFFYVSFSQHTFMKAFSVSDPLPGPGVF